MDDDRRTNDMNNEKSRAMWIVGYVLLAIVILIALYSFIGS